MPSDHPPHDLFTPPRPTRIIMDMKQLTFAATMLTALFLSATQALAALPAKPGDPAPDKPYTAYLIGFVLLAGVCVGTFKTAGRSHLD